MLIAKSKHDRLFGKDDVDIQFSCATTQKFSVRYHKNRY